MFLIAAYIETYLTIKKCMLDSFSVNNWNLINKILYWVIIMEKKIALKLVSSTAWFPIWGVWWEK